MAGWGTLVHDMLECCERFTSPSRLDELCVQSAEDVGVNVGSFDNEHYMSL